MKASTAIAVKKRLPVLPNHRHTAAAPQADTSPCRYNIVVTWNEETQSYGPTPDLMLMPYGYGTGGEWPAPGYLKWYIVPNGNDDVRFSTTSEKPGIRFATLPNLEVHYGPGARTASVQWINDGNEKQRFKYDVNLIVNGAPVLIDPDVENQAPPNWPPYKRRPRPTK